MHICPVPCTWSVACILKKNWETVQSNAALKKIENVTVEEATKHGQFTGRILVVHPFFFFSKSQELF